MPQQNKKTPTPLDDPADAREGLVLEPGDAESWKVALELTRDYRGDTTLVLRDGTELIGFVFDVDWTSQEEPAIRMDLAESGERATVPSSEVTCIRLSGRDPAAGKTWENWVKRYAEKRLAGEEASIECEPLETDETSSAS